MKCCTVDLGICTKCRTDDVVHIERERATERGLGCVNCGTASVHTLECAQGKCNEAVYVFTAVNNPPMEKKYYCQKHE